ncbi:MAG: hypothetical protein ACM3TR_00455 [Caulobacteraceae bacterium]
MKRFAAIDIGTNSMRLMLCEVNGSAIVKKEKELIITRIGKNVSKTSAISVRSMERNIEALKYFKNRADKYGAEKIVAIATSAVRDASNKEEFVKSAKSESGIDVMVIEGKEEAELGIKGVMSEIDNHEVNVLVIDVGGGSTELVLGNKDGIEYSTSINVGTVRLTEQFIKGNPISDSDIKDIKSRLMEQFSEPLQYLSSKRIDSVVAIGGTATTIGAIFRGLSIYNPDIVHNTDVNLSFVTETFNRLKDMTVKQRYEVKGLQKERADVVPAGMLILQHLLEGLKKEKVKISENDNLEGAVVKYIICKDQACKA